jgi:hypothetical protein
LGPAFMRVLITPTTWVAISAGSLQAGNVTCCV